MSTTRILIGLAAVGFLGVAAAVVFYRSETEPSSHPDNTFRLTVADVLNADQERVSQLVIETRGKCKYTISSGGAVASAVMTLTPDGRSRVARVPVLAVRLSPRDSDEDLVKTVVAMGSVVREVPRGQPLGDTLTLTAQGGIYPLDTPLVIGRVDGRELSLVVKQEVDQFAAR